MRATILTVLLISVAMHATRANDKGTPLKKDRPVPLTAPFDAVQAKAGQESWARSLGKSNPVEKNSIGMGLVLIPPGQFRMGSPPAEKDGNGTEDQVQVTLTRPFYLGTTEVTQAEWKQVMGTKHWQGNDDARDGDDFPASYVSWDEARTFCKKLSAKENAAYRLPTEAEWEYACRAGTTTRFSFGDDASKLGEFAWHDDNAEHRGEKFAHAVGQKQANPFGLYDMHGNVWESCEDSYTERIPGGPNPLVSIKGSRRVLRGGCWFSDAALCRSADRSRDSQTTRSSFVGFRVVRSIDL